MRGGAAAAAAASYNDDEEDDVVYQSPQPPQLSQPPFDDEDEAPSSAAAAAAAAAAMAAAAASPGSGRPVAPRPGAVKPEPGELGLPSIDDKFGFDPESVKSNQIGARGEFPWTRYRVVNEDVKVLENVDDSLYLGPDAVALVVEKYKVGVGKQPKYTIVKLEQHHASAVASSLLELARLLPRKIPIVDKNLTAFATAEPRQKGDIRVFLRGTYIAGAYINAPDDEADAAAEVLSRIFAAYQDVPQHEVAAQERFDKRSDGDANFMTSFPAALRVLLNNIATALNGISATVGSEDSSGTDAGVNAAAKIAIDFRRDLYHELHNSNPKANRRSVASRAYAYGFTLAALLQSFLNGQLLTLRGTGQITHCLEEIIDGEVIETDAQDSRINAQQSGPLVALTSMMAAAIVAIRWGVITFEQRVAELRDAENHDSDEFAGAADAVTTVDGLRALQKTLAGKDAIAEHKAALNDLDAFKMKPRSPTWVSLTTRYTRYVKARVLLELAKPFATHPRVLDIEGDGSRFITPTWLALRHVEDQTSNVYRAYLAQMRKAEQLQGERAGTTTLFKSARQFMSDDAADDEQIQARTAAAAAELQRSRNLQGRSARANAKLDKGVVILGVCLGLFSRMRALCSSKQPGEFRLVPFMRTPSDFAQLVADLVQLSDANREAVARRAQTTRDNIASRLTGVIAMLRARKEAALAAKAAAEEAKERADRDAENAEQKREVAAEQAAQAEQAAAAAQNVAVVAGGMVARVAAVLDQALELGDDAMVDEAEKAAERVQAEVKGAIDAARQDVARAGDSEVAGQHLRNAEMLRAATAEAAAAADAMAAIADVELEEAQGAEADAIAADASGQLLTAPQPPTLRQLLPKGDDTAFTNKPVIKQVATLVARAKSALSGVYTPASINELVRASLAVFRVLMLDSQAPGAYAKAFGTKLQEWSVSLFDVLKTNRDAALFTTEADRADNLATYETARLAFEARYPIAAGSSRGAPSDASGNPAKKVRTRAMRHTGAREDYLLMAQRAAGVGLQGAQLGADVVLRATRLAARGVTTGVVETAGAVGMGVGYVGRGANYGFDGLERAAGVARSTVRSAGTSVDAALARLEAKLLKLRVAKQ